MGLLALEPGHSYFCNRKGKGSDYTLPLFTGFLDCLFLGEAIGIIHLFSMIVILSGILMANQSAQ